MQTLKHFGVLGMRWGRRKAQDSRKSRNSSDHETVSAIRKKKIADMTDDEIKIATTRMKLVSQYRKESRSSKKISEMSNEDLKAGLRRAQLLKEDWRFGVRKTKSIKNMSDEEVKNTLNRHFLEKSYRELSREPLQQVYKFINSLYGFVKEFGGTNGK